MLRSFRSPALGTLAPIIPASVSELCRSVDVIKFKTCSTCREAKSFEHFAKNRAQRDGRDNACRACVKVRKAQAYHKKKVIEKSKRRPIVGNRVVDAASLKILKILHATDDVDKRYQSVISMLLEVGAA